MPSFAAFAPIAKSRTAQPRAWTATFSVISRGWFYRQSRWEIGRPGSGAPPTRPVNTTWTARDHGLTIDLQAPGDTNPPAYGPKAPGRGAPLPPCSRPDPMQPSRARGRANNP